MKNRDGSYRKIMINETSLKEQQAYILSGIKALSSLSLTPMDFTTLYILFFLRLNHPKNYLQQHTKNQTPDQFPKLLEMIPAEFNLTPWEKNKLNSISGIELFTLFNLRGIPKSIHRAMVNWYEGKWKIEMLHIIPSAKQLLFMQVRNCRVLTLINDENRLTSHILGSRDPLSFALHDLMHADQFFNNIYSQKGQLGFYKWVAGQYDNKLLQKKLIEDKKFSVEFDYVVSDMNAYVIHLLKSFKSCFSRANADNIFIDICISSEIPLIIFELLKKINFSDLSEKEEREIVTYFENQQDYVL